MAQSALIEDQNHRRHRQIRTPALIPVAAARHKRSGCRFQLRQIKGMATAQLASVGAPVKETLLPKPQVQDLKAATTRPKKSGGGLDKNSRRLLNREKAIRRQISNAIAILALEREGLQPVNLSRVKMRNPGAGPRTGLTIVARLPRE